jgi:DNA-binding NtrC family response regulator
VRELENVIEGAIALGTSTYIGRDELPLSVTLKAPEPAELGQRVTELNACKKTIIERALRKTSLNRAEVARLLDLNPKYFSALCKEFHVK